MSNETEGDVRNQSAKFRARAAEARPFRKALIARIGKCEVCGHDPNNVRPGWVAWELAVHEIANGANRQKALDKPYATLVLCFLCHEKLGGKGEWPEARQLAVLRRSRGNDFDLPAYNLLVGRGPDRVTLSEVDAWEDG